MIAGRRAVRESTRAFGARFAVYKPIALARSGFMTERRKAAARLPSCLRSQRRAYQALNVMGRRIWADKPVPFGGYRWLARRATVSSFAA